MEHGHSELLLFLVVVAHGNGVHEDFMANVFDAGLVAGCFGAWNLNKLVLPIIRNVVPSAVESDWLACALALRVGSSREYGCRVQLLTITYSTSD